jgi:hypothetical protein
MFSARVEGRLSEGRIVPVRGYKRSILAFRSGSGNGMASG